MMQQGSWLGSTFRKESEVPVGDMPIENRTAEILDPLVDYTCYKEEF